MNSTESNAPEITVVADVTEVDTVKKDKKPGKLFVIISYALVLAGLVAALFIPIYRGEMLIKYLFAAVNEFLQHLFRWELKPTTYGSFFIKTPLIVYEWVLILAYFVSLILSLIMLLPVILGKPQKQTNLKCAFAAEFIAFVIVLAFATCELFLYPDAWYNYATLIPLGITIIVMAAQSIKYKGWLGVVKFVVFLLALLTLFTLTDIAAAIPALHDPLLSVSGSLGAYDKDVTFMGAYPGGLSGLYEILLLSENSAYLTEKVAAPELISRILFSLISIFLVISIFTDLLGLVIHNKTRQKTDGRRKRGEPLTHKGWFTFALVRYITILVLILAALLLGLLVDGFWKVGIYSYFTLLFVIFALIVEIVRYNVAKAKLKAYKKEQRRKFNNETIVIKDPALENEQPAANEPIRVNVQLNYLGDEELTEPTPAEEPVEEEQPVEANGEQLTFTDVQPVEEQPQELEEELNEEEPVAEEPAEVPVPVEEEQPAPVEEEPVEAPIYANTPFYDEPEPAEQPEEEKSSGVHIDPFVDKLTDKERAEFFDVFVNRNRGAIGTIPVYEINGDNSDFFLSVFIHINRTREMCSESLLSKIYNEINRG